MKVKLRSYSTRDNYERDYPSNEQQVLTIGRAIEIARENISKVRNTNKFLAYKIFDSNNELKHKLPC